MLDQGPLVQVSNSAAFEGDCACSGANSSPPRLRWVRNVEGGEKDCACPDTGLIAPTIPSLHAGAWQRSPDLYRSPLPDQHEVIFAPSPSAGIALLNDAASHMLDEFTVPRRLDQIEAAFPSVETTDVKQAALQFAQIGLLRPAGEVEPVCSPAPDTLTAWLHVTSRCNLSCPYCYICQRDATMSDKTGQAAVQAVFRSAVRHNFRAVKLKYAGGEPTLNFPLVRLLHHRARALAKLYDLELKEVVLSNGVALTDEMLIALRDMEMRLAISLDGIGAVHDAQRGQGTFVRVASSIDRAIALGLRPYISVTVTSRNIDTLPDVVSYILERDLLFNLNFYRAHACSGDRDSFSVENERLIQGVRAGLDVIRKRLPRRSLVRGLLDRVQLGYPHTLPCGAGESYVVIDCEGRISMCQMEMDREVGSIWDNDPLLAVRSSESGFYNLEVEAKSECNSCPWRYWCAGGCPLLAYRSTNRNDTRSPYCEVYTALLPEILRLEGLRLLRSPPEP